jgi:hypothetical protein
MGPLTGECPLVGDEPPFVPGTIPPLETVLSLSTSIFLVGCLGPGAGIAIRDLWRLPNARFQRPQRKSRGTQWETKPAIGEDA